MSRGKFITLEGSEGCGKTTNLIFIADYLKNKGINLIQTREPGGTVISEKIRALLLDKENTDLVDDAELLLMFAARAQHLKQKILPAIHRGDWVLSDRFTDSTFAYQGFGRGIDLEKINQLEHWVQNDFRPDKTFILDLPVEVGMHRAAARAELDRFESEKINFFEKVRQGFLSRANQNPSRYCIIDASKSLEAVQKELSSELDALCNG